MTKNSFIIIFLAVILQMNAVAEFSHRQSAVKERSLTKLAPVNFTSKTIKRKPAFFNNNIKDIRSSSNNEIDVSKFKKVQVISGKSKKDTAKSSNKPTQAEVIKESDNFKNDIEFKRNELAAQEAKL